MPLLYSTESAFLPTNAPDLLDWAAAHIEHQGFHDGSDGRLFGQRGGVTSTRHLIPSMLGAFDVAAGDGRRGSSNRTYDNQALYAAQRLALDVLSDFLAGGAMPHDPHFAYERHRRYMLMAWGKREGRTRDEAAAAFRHAARLAKHAQAAIARPGRQLSPVTSAGLLGWAAAHLEDVTMRPGGLTHDPEGFVNTAPCTLLHAVDRAQRTAQPIPSDEPPRFHAFNRARDEALRVLASHLAGEEVTAGPDEPAGEADRRRREIVLSWGNEPGRTESEAVEALRVAALAVTDAPEDEPHAERSVLF